MRTLLLAVLLASCATTPVLNTRRVSDINARVADNVGKYVCVEGILIVDSAHGSEFPLPRTMSEDALYADRIYVPLRAIEAMRRFDYTTGPNRARLCGRLFVVEADQIIYRLELDDEEN